MKLKEEGRKIQSVIEHISSRPEMKLQIFNTLFWACDLFRIRSWPLRGFVEFESKFLNPLSQLNHRIVQMGVVFRKILLAILF